MQDPPVDMQFHADGALAIATVTGPASADDFARAIDGLSGFARSRSLKRALADCAGTTRKLPLTDHITIGRRMGRELHHLERVATVLPEAHITRASEKVAAPGVVVRVFEDAAAALQWLRE